MESNPIYSGAQIQLKWNEKSLSSDGFYPEQIALKANAPLQDALFNVFCIQYDENKIKILKDDAIQYNREIVIQHQKSGKFLSCLFFQGGWIVTLTQRLSEFCFFCFTPCFRAQVFNNNFVVANSEVSLIISPINQILQDNLDEHFLNIDSQDQSMIIISKTLRTNFTLQCHQILDEKEECLRYGSYIKVKQIETNSYLKILTEKQAEQLIKQSLNQFDAISEFECIFKSKPDIFWYKTEQISNVDDWQIFHPMKYGEFVNQEDYFYLQNASHSMFIGQNGLVDNINDAQLFSFSQQNKSSNFFIGYLLNDQKVLTFQGNENSVNQIEFKQSDSKIDLVQLEYQSMNVVQQNWFESVKQLLKRSSKIFFTNIIDAEEWQKINFQLSLLQKAIQDLICFTLEVGDQIESLDRKYILYARKSKQNQVILRNQSILLNLVNLLDQINSNINLNEIEEQIQNIICSEEQQYFYLQLQKIIQTIFIFLEAFCAFNQENFLLVLYSYSQYFSLLGNQFGAFSCLMEIFSTNQNVISYASEIYFREKENQLLESQQKKYTIVDVLFQRGKHLQQVKNKIFWPNLPQFLSILCMNNDQVCKCNQKLIGGNLMKNNWNAFQLVAKNDSKFYILMDDKQYELNDIYQECSKGNINYMQQLNNCWKHIDSLLNLIAVLCLERNVENILQFRKLFPLKHLLSNIQNSQNNENLRFRLIVVLINLYIDFFPIKQKNELKLIFAQKELKENDNPQQNLNFQNENLIENLLEVIYQLLQQNLVYNNKIILTHKNYQILTCFYKLITLKLTKDDILKKDYSELFLNTFYVLPDSLTEKEPHQSLTSEFEQFQVNKNSFNQLAKVFINWISYDTEMKERKLIKICISDSQKSEFFNIQFNNPRSNNQVIKALIDLLKHPFLNSQIKLKVFQLMMRLYQPKQSIIRRLKKCTFLENQDEYELYSQFKRSRESLIELLFLEEKKFKLVAVSINKLYKMFQVQNHQVFLQRICRTLNFDQKIFEYLTYFWDQRNTLPQLIDPITLCQECFIFLKFMCINNTKNKIQILKNFTTFEQFLTIKDIGQYALLKTIYTDSYRLIESVSIQTIQNLLNNLSVNSIEVLSCLLHQQNISSTKNILIIVNQIKQKGYFKDLLQPYLQDIQISPQNQSILSSKYVPQQILQIKALQFLSQLIKFAPSQQQAQLQICFPSSTLLQLILPIKDIFLFQTMQNGKESRFHNIQSIILNTILKQRALQFLNQMLMLNDNQKFDEDFVEIAKQFINQENSSFSIKIKSLNFEQVNQIQNSQNKLQELRKFIKNINLEKMFQSEESDVENEFLNDEAHCFSFNNYAILLFDLVMNLSQLISEYIDRFDESSSKSKSNRNSSSIAFKTKSMSIALLDLNQRELNIVSQKLIPYSEVKFHIDNLVFSIEQYLNENLVVEDITFHQELLQQKQQQLKLLYLRQLDLKGFKFDQKIQNSDMKKISAFLTPKYYHNQNVYELAIIQNSSQENEKLKQRLGRKQIDALFQNQHLLQRECYEMFQNIYQRLFFVNYNFEIQIVNFKQVVTPLIRIVKQSFNNLSNNYYGVIQILEFLAQMLDIHAFVRQNQQRSQQAYSAFKSEKYQTQSEQILQHKAQKELQNLIINEGFFEIFLSFCDQYDTMRILQFSELQCKNTSYIEQLFYKFALVSIKLIRGFQNSNQLAQEKIISLMKTNHNNSLIKIMWQNFDQYMNLSDELRFRYNLEFDMKRVQYAYEFNESHTLEKNQQRLGIMQIQIKLIQLMTEDHYRLAQDFLREQPGFSRCFDILQKVLDILYFQFPSETFQNLNQDNYEIIIGCFDCLKELIQGPCPENQAKVCSLQFLRFCQKLLTFDDSQAKFLQIHSNFVQNKEENENRTREQTQHEYTHQIQGQIKTSIQQQQVDFYKNYQYYCFQLLLSLRKSNNQNYRLFMLSEIKYRCSTTLESLTDDQINLSDTLGRISSVIDEKLLIKNISIQYEKFKILHQSGKNYSNDVFSHLFGEKQQLSLKPTEMTPYSDASWSVEQKITIDIAIRDFCDSFIIETGFSLFNILAQIYQNKQKDVLERIYEQIDQEKQQKQSYKSLLLYNLYQSWFSIQQITEQLTQNMVNAKQKETITDKLFTDFQLKKIPGEKDANQKKLGYRALRFYATRTGSIEIVVPEQRLKQVIFPLIPQCFTLNDTIKQKFLSDLDRATQLTKLESLQFNSTKNIQKLKSEYKFQQIYKKYVFINMIASNQAIWKQVIFYVIVLQNIMIIITSDETKDNALEDFLLALNIFQIILQFVCFFIFIIRKLPYLRIKSQQIVYDRQIKRIKKREIKYKYLDNSKSIVQQDDFILERTDKFLLEQNKCIKMLQNVSDRLVLVKYIFLDYEMIYFLIFTTIAILGLFRKTMLALLLLDVFWRFPVLTAMINSVWRPIISIVLTLALYFILQYYYSLLIYWFFSYDTNYSPYCKNLQQCFSFIVDVTFKKDSGSAGYVAQSNSGSQTYGNPNFHYDWLNFWEFCYYFFVISLTYSIFTGLILDSFGADREDAEELEQDIQGQCLVCGIDKSIIEKKTKHKKGFRFHIKNEHSIWNYIFFISYIQVKKQSEYNGIESFVDEQLNNENISWLPIGRTLSIIEETQNNVEEEIQNKINEISQQIDKKIAEKNQQKLN